MTTLDIASRIHAAVPGSDWRTHPDGSEIVSAGGSHIVLGESLDPDTGAIVGIDMTLYEDDEAASQDFTPAGPDMADQVVARAVAWLR